MSDTPRESIPFIPAWLDDSGLSAAEMRVFIHLIRSADNSTGIAWPSYRRMTEVTKMSRATIARCIEVLEERNLIRKVGKPFGGSCRYRVLPMVSPESALDASNRLTGEHIGDAPIVSPEKRNMQRDETSIVSPESKEGSPKKVLQRRKEDIGQSSEFELAVESTPTSPSALVGQIYEAYPKKVAKQDAVKAITKALAKHGGEFLLERTRAYATAIAWKDRQFIPHPATWFNGERFLDDPKEWERPAETSRNGKPQMSLEDAAKLLGGRAAYLTDHRSEKRAGEYPEPAVKLPRL